MLSLKFYSNYLFKTQSLVLIKFSLASTNYSFNLYRSALGLSLISKSNKSFTH
jgi:hypothetical protein